MPAESSLPTTSRPARLTHAASPFFRPPREMNVLIVFAHPEPQSFGASLLTRSVESLKAQHHEVRVSDLYAMGFDPVAGAADFKQRRFVDRLQYDREQKFAAGRDGFADDIQAELDKVLWCDLLILQFPLWWFSVPAIMKGWIDRVFVNGRIYGSGRRFDTGRSRPVASKR